jgi:hypothetical protein
MRPTGGSVFNRRKGVSLQPALTIAITQIRSAGPGRDYLAHRMAAGDTKTEAIRALRRRISDKVFRRLGADEAARAALDVAARAAA